MRNLKKILALVLALVMSMSLVTVASAGYADQDQIDARYAEAVEVLSDMGIFKGYNGGESFGPKALITREEVATMMYRVISTDVTDTNKGMFVEAAKFSDVPATKWSAGYIGYCYNGNYVKGYEDGTFGPAKNVTGYEVLAMILRAVGFDRNGEFSGSNWKKNIGTVAQQLGILNNVAPTVVLSQPATRELVAELIFRTMATVDMVEYTPAFGYQPVLVNTVTETVTLGQKNFNLVPDYDVEFVDYYGRPGYVWNYNVYPYETAIEEEPVKVYNVPVTECVLATDMNLSKNSTYTNVDMYVDGVGFDGTTGHYKYGIQPYDTVTTVGGQGTILEVYDDSNRLVVIHTWLAQVTAVTPVVRDAAGHIISQASIALSIYDQNDGSTSDVSWTSNYNFDYAAGDYVLVNTTGAKNTKTDAVNTAVDGVVVHNNLENCYITILGKASAKVGAQTYIWTNAAKHTIEGVDYNDAEWFRLDKAGVSPAQFNWLFDQFGNVIGAVELPASAPVYGILENLQWINPVGSAGYAQGTIRYTNGDTELKTIYAIDNDAADGVAAAVLSYKGVNDIVDPTTGTVSDNYAENGAYLAEHLYRVTLDGYGRATLTHVNTVDENGTVTNNELTSASIYTGGYEVQGDQGSLYINNDTVFMVYKNWTWTLVTGYKAIENYTDKEIDWLNTDSDPYLEFVFVKGSSDSSSGNGLWFRTNASYRHHITSSGVLCETTGLVDGAQKTLVQAYDLCATEMYDLYKLTYTDGVVTGAEALSDGDTYGIYKVAKIEGGVDTTIYNGIVLSHGADLKFNIVGVETPTFGTWAQNLSANDIWVLYTVRDNADGSKTNIAAQVYIVPTGVNSTPGAHN